MPYKGLSILLQCSPPPSCNFSCEVTQSTVKVCKNTRKTSVFFSWDQNGGTLGQSVETRYVWKKKRDFHYSTREYILNHKTQFKMLFMDYSKFGLTQSYQIIFNRISKEIPGFHLCKKYPTFSHLPRSSRNWKNVLFEKLIFVFLHRNCYFLVRTGTGFQWNHARE